MDVKLSCLLLLSLFNCQSDGFFMSDSVDVLDPGKALFLTPYIERGEIEKAQFLSRVDPLPEECTDSYLKSYSGFITVQKQYNSNMFFWYIPAQEADPDTAPLMLWLDGGPGASSMMALFVMNGPFYINEHIKTKRREADWTKKFSIIYLDNPVGAGFSFANDTAGYARNETDVARDLYSFLNQFFTLFPTLRSTDFYVGGESYAGKYLPAIGYKIHTENPTAVNKINLKGLFMGAPFTDPTTIISVYPDFLYHMGMMNSRERDHIRSEINRVDQLINTRDFQSSLQILSELMFGAISSPSYIMNVTGYTISMNVLQTTVPEEMNYFMKYVNRTDVRQALHVGKTPYDPMSPIVFAFLSEDFLQSVKPWLVALLNSNQYKIMMYGGQMDIVVCTPCIEATIDSMTDWTDIGAYRQAEKKIWRLKPDDGDVAGYIQSVGNFTWVMEIDNALSQCGCANSAHGRQREVSESIYRMCMGDGKFQAIVRGAGHIGPADQPERHLDLVTRFLRDIPF